MTYEHTTEKDIAIMARETLRKRARQALKRSEYLERAYQKSPESLGRLVQRVQTLPGATLEQVADIIEEYGLEKF